MLLLVETNYRLFGARNKKKKKKKQERERPLLKFTLQLISMQNECNSTSPMERVSTSGSSTPPGSNASAGADYWETHCWSCEQLNEICACSADRYTIQYPPNYIDNHIFFTDYPQYGRCPSCQELVDKCACEDWESLTEEESDYQTEVAIGIASGLLPELCPTIFDYTICPVHRSLTRELLWHPYIISRLSL